MGPLALFFLENTLGILILGPPLLGLCTLAIVYCVFLFPQVPPSKLLVYTILFRFIYFYFTYKIVLPAFVHVCVPEEGDGATIWVPETQTRSGARARFNSKPSL